MSQIDNDIATLKAKIDSARIAQARAQATRETAQKTIDAAEAKLKEAFGVDSIEQARVKLAELQTDLQTKIQKISQELDNNDL